MDKMNKPEEYIQNKITPTEVHELLQEYLHKMRWRSDGYDSLLDIGCGPGNITYEQLIPFLPSTFKRIVGADISKEMLEYSQSHYKHSKLTFIYMNIEDENIEKCIDEQFDHITSFFVLHFVNNQNLAMKNIYNLLNENGDLLLILFGANSVFDAYIKLKDTEKWSTYMFDYKKYISPYHTLPNKKEVFENVLITAGFTDYKIDIVDNRFPFKLEILKDVIKSVNGMYDRIPKELQDEWLNEIVRLSCPQSDPNNSESDYMLKYTLIRAYARK